MEIINLLSEDEDEVFVTRKREREVEEEPRSIRRKLQSSDESEGDDSPSESEEESSDSDYLDAPEEESGNDSEEYPEKEDVECLKRNIRKPSNRPKDLNFPVVTWEDMTELERLRMSFTYREQFHFMSQNPEYTEHKCWAYLKGVLHREKKYIRCPFYRKTGTEPFCNRHTTWWMYWDEWEYPRMGKCWKYMHDNPLHLQPPKEMVDKERSW